MTRSGKEDVRFVKPGVLSREEIARLEIGHTAISPSFARLLVTFFLAVIVFVPVVDLLRPSYDSDAAIPLDIFGMLFDSAVLAYDGDQGFVADTFSANRQFLRDIDEYEDRLVDSSVLTENVRPSVQLWLTRTLGAGSRDAYVGEDGWLFYRRGLEYQWGPGFLDTDAQAAQDEAASLPAIREFRDELKERGVALIVMPTPVKGVVHPQAFASRAGDAEVPLQNASYDDFIERLRALGVEVFDPARDLIEGKKRDLQRYLKTDTHWTPRALENVSASLARTLRDDYDIHDGPDFELVEEWVAVENLGDVASMMGLPADQRLYPRETVMIRQVRQRNGELIQPAADAEVLLLGDSFSNVYSLETMGWGSGAGLAERLAFNLKAPVDVIAINDGGSFATRQSLARDLARGDDRLRGKKVVVWQFAVRELVFGDWKQIPLILAERKEVDGGDDVIVEGKVAEISTAQNPDIVYPDYLRMLHLVEIKTTAAETVQDDLVVFVWSIRQGEPQPGSSIRRGQRIRLKLAPWATVSRDLDRIARSELDDLDLILRTPWWGEVAGTE